MSEKTLQELLTLMRRMYVAALDDQWETVNELDVVRNGIFDTLNPCPNKGTSVTKAAVSEIIELDQAVLSLASAGITTSQPEFLKAHVSSTAGGSYGQTLPPR